MESGTNGLDPGSCPDCGARASVSDGICDVCLADLGERHGRSPVDRAMASAVPGGLRFIDVLTEIQAVVHLADPAGGGEAVVAAGRRAERLLGSLRDQFLRDLGLPAVGPAGQPGR